MELMMAILIGIGLSAAVGFRVFTPLLVTSIAEKASMVQLAEGFSWIGSTPALIAFAVATILEVGTYYIPIVDQIMKVIASPIAVIAGILLTASFIGEMSPFLTWSIAIIAGGGTASVSQFATTSIRGASTIGTGGIGNALLSVGEGFIAMIVSILSILAPIIAIIFIGLLFVGFLYIIKSFKKKFTNKNISLQE